LSIRDHLARISLLEVSKHRERLGSIGVVAVHYWVHKAGLQLISTVSERQLAVEKNAPPPRPTMSR